MKIDKELPLSRLVERRVRVEAKIEPRHKAKIVEIAKRSGRSMSNLVERWSLETLDKASDLEKANIAGNWADRRQEKIVGGRSVLSLRLPTEIISRLDVLAASKGLNRSAMVSDIVQTALRRPAKAVR